MKYIIVSEFNRNYLLFLSYFIVIIIKELFKIYYTPTNDIIAYLNENYSFTLSDFLCFIPMMIIKFRSKSHNKGELIENDDDKNNALILLNPQYEHFKKKLKRIFKLIIIISIVDFLGKYFYFVFSIILTRYEIFLKTINLNGTPVFNIISICILSTCILHSHFYRHHYFSLIINLIFLVILIINDEINILKEEDWNSNFLYIANTLTGIFYSFENLYEKVLLSTCSISIYTLIFYRGVAVSIITILCSIILIFIDVPDENGDNSCIFTRYWKLYDDKINIIFIIGILFTNFMFNIHIMFIIDKFSPTHYAMATILDIFGSLLIQTFFGNIKISDFFVGLIIYSILIFAGLIYNEIIILNFFGLQRFTKLFLEIEAKTDISQIKFNNNTFDEDDLEMDEEIKKQDDLKNAIKLKEISDEEDKEESII